MPNLTFLHTSPVHIETFGRLAAELAPHIPVAHVVDEALLDAARAHGLTPEVRGQIARRVAQAAAQGAALVLCTCSTIGGAAEEAGALRVDRAMAEAAVAAGPRIVVLAALASTLAPTRELIASVAQASAAQVAIAELLCEGAWAHFERGDMAAYHRAIAAQLAQAAPQADVLVLAQASMAGAAALCQGIAVPILSSPRLGVQAAALAYERAVGAGG
ncbi:hypothetical protein F8S13_08250 [Chloroflexia bacterium SDU3-3]|nr:hypothetical protein F8S13_08250 [Chloroflexia bacterium SDU3-3]